MESLGGGNAIRGKGVGGMIQIDPLNLHLPLTLREWLWESYPDNLSGKLREASQAHKELVDAAVLHMEGHSQVQMENSQPPVVEVPVMTISQRRALFKDPYAVPTPIQIPATPAMVPKQGSFKELTAVCPSSNLVIGGTSISPPLHHITV